MSKNFKAAIFIRKLLALGVLGVSVLLLGCPGPQSGTQPHPDKVTIQGEITTLVKGDLSPGTTAKGSWCCSSCSTANTLSCSGCSSVPAGGCPTAGSGDGRKPILVDCPGTTTYDSTTGKVTCL
jgi:hypothetical protein